ncbi:MAG: hypothetical protein HYU36_06570 [Planctomycetes bacterium]|nr:hypothetical protein [Planctomycetota bacterium]
MRLIEIAQEDGQVREQILGLLRLAPFQRRSILNTQLDQMRLQGAPQEFIEAMASLLDDAVAERVIFLLKTV